MAKSYIGGHSIVRGDRFGGFSREVWRESGPNAQEAYDARRDARRKAAQERIRIIDAMNQRSGKEATVNETREQRRERKRADTRARRLEIDELINTLNIRQRLDSWSAFVRDLAVPDDLAPALMTSRVELLKLARPRALDIEECKALYDLIGGLMETNQALREHAAEVAKLVGSWSEAFKQLESLGWRIEHFANFRRSYDDEDDDQ